MGEGLDSVRGGDVLWRGPGTGIEDVELELSDNQRVAILLNFLIMRLGIVMAQKNPLCLTIQFNPVKKLYDMKKKLVVLLGSIACMSAVLPASAIQYTIDVGNSDISPYPGPYGTVDVQLNDATHALVTFTGAMSGGDTYIFGAAQALDVNVNATGGLNTGFSVGSFTGMSSPSPGSGNVSQFGSFNLAIDNFDGFTHAGSPMSFILTDLTGTWATDADVLSLNNKGSLAAAHIFVIDPTGDNVQTGYAGNGAARVPDGGATVWLLGSALAGLGMLRRKLGK